jgi:hypothetical protein
VDPSAVALATALVAFGWALVAFTQGTLDLAATGAYSRVYDDMAVRLWHGRFDIDPAVVGIEAFARDGRAYSYFGPWPAVLRWAALPFVDPRATPLAVLSCALATAVIAGAQALALGRVVAAHAAPTARRWLTAAGALAALATGPQVYLAEGPAVYHEAILWAYAWASVVVAIATGALLAGRPMTGRTWVVVGAAAGLALATRVSTGIGCLVAVGAWAIVATWSAWRTRGPAAHRRAVVAVALGAVVPVGGTLVVNHGRWGNPFEFADVRRQVVAERLFPGRAERHTEQGEVHIARVPFGVQYYWLPIWALPDQAGRPRYTAWTARWLDGAELPAGSFLVSEGWWVLLAAVGAAAVLRRQGGERAALAAVAAGLAVPAAAMHGFYYMAPRYRAEFLPIFVLLACAGVAAVGAAAGDAARWRRWRSALGAALVVSVAGSATMLVSARAVPFGPAVRTMAPWDLAVAAWAALLSPGSPGVVAPSARPR